MEDTTKDTVIFPLLVCDKSKTNPWDEVTDPNHAGYVGIKEHPMTYLGSEVDKIRVGLNFALETGVEDEIYAVNFRTALICHSFDDYDKDDAVGGENLADLLGLQMHSGGNYMEPKWSGVDVTSNDLFASANTYFGLTTNADVESATWTYSTYVNAVRDSTLKGKLKQCVPGGVRWHTIYKDRPFALRDEYGDGLWYNVPSKCKRQNQYTFLGLLVDCPQVGTGIGQFYQGAETAATSHINVGLDVFFNEKNVDFARN